MNTSIDPKDRPLSLRNWKGEQQVILWPAGRTVVRLGDCYLIQASRTRFSVVWGLEVRTNLDYARAAKEFGECVMHQAVCEGILKQ